MNRPRVVFRADGNAQIGLGHLARCLALAEMLSPDFACVFVSVNPPESALSLIGAAFPIIPVPQTAGKEEPGFLVREILLPADIVVLDGYHFDLAYQQQIKSACLRLVCIDDLNAQPFVADVVINHAPGVSPDSYQVQPYTRLCLGFTYALLRKPFLQAARQLQAGKMPANRQRSHILLTFGGADKHNLCETITRLLLDIPEVKKISVVLGAGSNRAFFAAEALQGKVTVYEGLSAEEMCSLMLGSGALLAPASTVVMEGLATLLPVICGYYVPEQEPPYQKLLASGCIVPAGDWNKITGAELQLAFANLPEKAVSVIDGKQPERFRELFRSLR